MTTAFYRAVFVGLGLIVSAAASAGSEMTRDSSGGDNGSRANAVSSAAGPEVRPAGRIPRDVVAALEAKLLSTMRAAATDAVRQRYLNLAPTIIETYDLPHIAEVVLGRGGRSLSADQRERFLAKFESLVIATFAAELKDYEGESFKFVTEKPLNRGRILVRSTLTKPAGKAHAFDYVLRETEGGWRIINVVVDGVSDLALKRTEYGTILEKDGFEGLLARVDSQVESRLQGLPVPGGVHVSADAASPTRDTR